MRFIKERSPNHPPKSTTRSPNSPLTQNAIAQSLTKKRDRPIIHQKVQRDHPITH